MVFDLAWLLSLSFREEGCQPTQDELYLALSEMALAISQGISTVWRAFYRGGERPQPVGMIEVREEFSPPLRHRYTIGRLIVLPKARHRGVARALIARAVQDLDPACPILAMTLKPMPRSYRRLGAKAIGVVMVGAVEDVQRRCSHAPVR